GVDPSAAGSGGSRRRASFTPAHPGQQRTNSSVAGVPGRGDPNFTTPGVGRADVWVLNPANLGTAVGGIPVRIMTFFTDTPRALAVGPVNTTVYVSGVNTANPTTSIIKVL